MDISVLTLLCSFRLAYVVFNYLSLLLCCCKERTCSVLFVVINFCDYTVRVSSRNFGLGGRYGREK